MAQYHLLTGFSSLPRERNQELVQRWITHCIEDAKKLHKSIGSTEVMFNRYGRMVVKRD